MTKEEFYSRALSFDEVEIIEEDKKIRKIKVNYSPDIEEKIFYEDGDKPNHYILGDAGTELLISRRVTGFSERQVPIYSERVP